MSTKTNKSVLSRVRKTKGGGVMASGKGRGHLNAKHSRAKKLGRKRQRDIAIPVKVKQRYLLA